MMSSPSYSQGTSPKRRAAAASQAKVTAFIYQVDAFTNEVFGGNPAAVVPLGSASGPLTDKMMQKIGMENNLGETGFYAPLQSPPPIYVPQPVAPGSPSGAGGVGGAEQGGLVEDSSGGAVSGGQMTMQALPPEYHYSIRWFSPTVEIDLCGHAAMGTAGVIFGRDTPPEVDTITLHTLKKGPLTIKRMSPPVTGGGDSESEMQLQMSFPADPE